MTLFDIGHYINDFILLWGWLMECLGIVLNRLWLPVKFVFYFFRSFVTFATSTVIEPDTSYTFATSTQDLLASIPFWDTIASMIGIVLLLIFGIGILKQFLKT